MKKSEETMNKEGTDLNLCNETVLSHTFPGHLFITSLPISFYILSLGEDDI